MADITYLTVPFEAATIEAAVPSSEIDAKSLSYVCGADGRYIGGLRRAAGFDVRGCLFLDVANSSALYSNLTSTHQVFNIVPFQLNSIDNLYIVKGYLIHYLLSAIPTTYHIGITWTAVPVNPPYTPVSGSADITSFLTSTPPSSAVMRAAVCDNKLFVVCDGLFAKTLYLKDGSKSTFSQAWAVTPLGAGPYAAVPPAPTEQSTFVSSNQTHYLFGTGRYQIAWRLRSTARNVVSALSQPLTLTLDIRTSSRALGYIYISGTQDTDRDGLFIDGDKVRIGSVWFEFDTNNSVGSGNIRVDISGLTTLSAQMQRFADVINATASCPVSAAAGDISVSLIAKQPGPDGNTIQLAKQEAGSKTQDIQLSGSTLTDGGRITNIPEPYCGATVKLPPVSSLLSTYGISSYNDLKAAWDTIEIFRTINLGDRILYAQISGYLYRETEVAVPSSDTDWNNLTITVGTVDDQSLLFRPYYNPATDVCRRIDHASDAAVFKDTLFVVSSTSDGNRRRIYYSNPRVAGYESFTAYHLYECSPQEGSPTNLLPAGDVMLITCSNCILQVQLPIETGAMLFSSHHQGKSFPRGGAHIVGNLMYAVNEQGLFVCNTTSMDLAYMISSHRLFAGRAVSLESVCSAYDQTTDASYFAITNIGILAIYHTTQTFNILYPTTTNLFLVEAPFPYLRSTFQPIGRYLILFLAPSWAGAECSLSSPQSSAARNSFANTLLTGIPILTYEIVSATSSTLTLKKRTGNVLNATYASFMTSMPFVVSSGQLAGVIGHIMTFNYPTDGDTFTIYYSGQTLQTYYTLLKSGDYISFLTLPFIVQLPELKNIAHAQFPSIPIRELVRVVWTSASFKVNWFNPSAGEPAALFYVNAVRNFQPIDYTAAVPCPITTNPSDSVCALRLDGISLEPYILCAYPAPFELTCLDLGCIISRSRRTE